MSRSSTFQTHFRSLTDRAWRESERPRRHGPPVGRDAHRTESVTPRHRPRGPGRGSDGRRRRRSGRAARNALHGNVKSLAVRGPSRRRVSDNGGRQIGRRILRRPGTGESADRGRSRHPARVGRDEQTAALMPSALIAAGGPPATDCTYSRLPAPARSPRRRSATRREGRLRTGVRPRSSGGNSRGCPPSPARGRSAAVGDARVSAQALSGEIATPMPSLKRTAGSPVGRAQVDADRRRLRLLPIRRREGASRRRTGRGRSTSRTRPDPGPADWRGTERRARSTGSRPR